MRHRNLCVLAQKVHKCVQILFMLFSKDRTVKLCIYKLCKLCTILVLLAYSHKYRVRINNRLYGIYIPSCFSAVEAVAGFDVSVNDVV